MKRYAVYKDGKWYNDWTVKFDRWSEASTHPNQEEASRIAYDCDGRVVEVDIPEPEVPVTVDDVKAALGDGFEVAVYSHFTSCVSRRNDYILIQATTPEQAMKLVPAAKAMKEALDE